MRLVDGDHTCSGRVEVYYDGRWGTVCDSYWGSSDGQVVCREVGCGNGIEAVRDADFGEGSGPVWLNYVGCSGPETTVRNCDSRDWGDNSCQHNSDSGVICECK